MNSGPPLLTLFVLLSVAARAQSLDLNTLKQIDFEQKVGARVSLNLQFRDEDGKDVQLGQFFGTKPVVLVPGYYGCPMLCTMVLNGMVASAEDIRWSIGRDFEVVNVSINPRESPALAAAKKRSYTKLYGRDTAAAGWHFLTGEDSSIKPLMDQIGFHYAYDPASGQYAHPSGFVVLTPDGRVYRYFLGVKFSPDEMASALRKASAREAGSPVQQLLLLCFHYNPMNGKYSGTIIVLLRILGAMTIAGCLWLILTLVRGGRAGRAASAPGVSGGAPADIAKEPGVT